jgi:hypothetical protein
MFFDACILKAKSLAIFWLKKFHYKIINIRVIMKCEFSENSPKSAKVFENSPKLGNCEFSQNPQLLVPKLPLGVSWLGSPS